MNTVLRRIAFSIAIIFVVLIGVTVLGYTMTNGDYSLPATVDMDASLPQIMLGGKNFHSETFGDRSNPTLIVLHGGPGADYRYLLDLRVLADTYFVVFYDQRGSGLSSRVDAETLTTQDMIDDLDLFVDHYSPDKQVYVIGHSWGAMLASAYVGQHPDKVAKLVLAEPGALTNETMGQFEQHFSSVIDADFILSVVPIMFESLHIADAGERADYFAGRTSALWESDAKNPYHCPSTVLKHLSWRAGSAVSNAILASTKTLNGTTDVSILSENAHRFIHKVLFLASACNTWLGEDLQRQHAALFLSAEVVVIKNAGHYLFNDNLDDSLKAVRAYFM